MGIEVISQSSGDKRRDISVRLHVLARQLRSRFDRAVSSLGVTRSQWQLIGVVGSRPGTTQRTIAETLEISEASAGRLIDKLCADGMLERRERDDDRRARAIYLTAKSEPLLAHLSVIARENEERLFRGMSDEELDHMLEYLDRIHRNAAND